MKKSIFLFFAAILCAMSVQSANTMRIYCKQAQSWWKSDGAAVGAYYWGTGGNANSWPGTRMTKVSGQTDLWYIDVDIDKYQNIIFTRVPGSGTVSDWGAKTNDLTIGNTKNQYTITQSSGAWDGAKSAGSWGTYKPTSTAALATSAANIFVGGQATLTSSLTSNASANTIKETAYAISPAGANVSGNTFTATAEGTYTVTATVTYYPLGCPTLTSTATATATITVASASEPQHDVKVTWMSGETELQPSQTLSVGESTGYPVEAPEFKDYTFSGWTLGTGVQSANETANPINITTKASGEYTLIANYDYIEPVIKTIYCKMEYNWWTQASAAISAFISGTYGESATSLGTLMTLAPLEGNVWKIDVDVARYQKIRFIRVNPEGTSDWGARTGLVEIPTDDKNLYTITQSTDKWSGECSGTWGVYEAPATAPKRYITGNKELVGGEGWKANEIEMTYDNGTSTYSHTFLASALTAGTEYKLKVTEGNWDGGKWGTINGTIPGVSNDGDGNVCFTLKTAGDVNITFDGSKITVSTTGEFKVPVVYPYYIMGTMNSWSVKEEYGLADEDEDGVYTREITLAAGEHFFKINIGNWDSQWGWSNVTGKYAEATDAKDDNKIKITLASEKTFVVEFNKSKNQITFDGLTTNEDYYTVVGVAELLGDAWAKNNDANKMVKQGDGSYKLVKENVTLAAIGYDWKIAKNGDWWNDAAIGVNPSEGNNTLTITTAGRYNVTFTLAADLTTAIVETELLEAAEVIPDCFISGNKNLTGKETEWQGNEFTMVYNEETETWSYTVAGLQPEKAYELKVVCGGTWYSYADLASVPTGVIEGNDHSIAFKMAVAGDVVVTYNVEDGITLTGNFAEPETYDYYLTGTLVGGWSAKQQGIEKDGELYKATFNNLAAGTYQFKITDGQFNTEEDKTHEHTTLAAEYKEVSYVDGNIQFVTEEAKNITVIFDATANKITLEGLTIVTHTYTIAGDAALCGEAWNWELAANDMTNNGDGTYTWTKAGVEVNGELSFKVFVDHKSEPAYPAENWVIKPENYEGNGVYDVTITFTESSKEVVVALTKQVVTPTPDYTRAVTPGNLGTICLPSNVPAGQASGATFYTLAGMDANGRVAFYEETGELEAGKSYLFQATATEIVCFYGTESVLTPDENGAMKGTFVDRELDGSDLTNIYYFAKNALWSCEDLIEFGLSLSVPANCAYVDMGKVADLTEPAPVGVRRITLGVNGQNTATGMENIDASAQPVKTIINGQLFILRGEKMYDAQGKLVK